MVQKELMEKLYCKLRGVPRYVLQTPAIRLAREKSRTKDNIEDASKGACRCGNE
ncbi:hypothetical protein BGZ76_000758, partial [Entomortierella beljakovae]